MINKLLKKILNLPLITGFVKFFFCSYKKLRPTPITRKILKRWKTKVVLHEDKSFKRELECYPMLTLYRKFVSGDRTTWLLNNYKVKKFAKLNLKERLRAYKKYLEYVKDKRLDEFKKVRRGNNPYGAGAIHK